ncbi:MAG TPA: polyphosphate polymerase domain-containing protein [Candidatus Limiplasma sp.]|nr:polyphosphate polymerase domain-containing protein [Candidatus Limiplasma sp.]HRX09367.1 polyphosphate polymerase domain-containing protein [Candidatus Limiplasma sp.]
MAVALPLRHELKFYINTMEYNLLSRALDRVLFRDPNGDEERNEYHIRSLYFDTYNNQALLDKINGVRDRDKYRLRIYNLSDTFIRMECKSKIGSLISKRSITIPRSLAEQLMAGDPTGLERTRSGLLQDLFREMTLNLLHPVVIVDYVREAYLYPVDEVRVTFDKQLRTGVNSIELFNPYVPTVPPIGDQKIILEVKYDRTLPPFIRDLLCTYVHSAQSSAISKYCICRRFEDLEY